MKLEKTMRIPVSGCDHRAMTSVPYIVSLFMDAATEHSEAMGIGKDAMDKTGLFWIAVRTMVKIHRLPKRMDEVTVTTWPEAPGRIRCNRYYTISSQGETLAEGKNEWAIIDLKSGRPQKLSSLYPEGLAHLPDVVCPEPFARFHDDFTDGEEVASYQVRSTDIDFGQHMNNVAYIRALFGTFTCKELADMAISGLEVMYKSQSYEGDILTIRRRKGEGFIDYAMIRENGDVAAIIRIS